MPIDSAVKAAAGPGAGLGDNSGMVPEDFRITVTPPEDIQPYLSRQYNPLKDRYAELMASAGNIPETISSDADSGKAGDLVKEIRLLDGRLDDARKIEKEPFQKGGATVDSFFKNMMEPLEKAKKTVLTINTAYLNKKKDEERRRLELEAQKKRDEEARLLREATQAEERRIAAEEARGVADAAAQEARDNKDELEQGRLDAEAALATAKLKKANARRDRDEAAFAAASAEVEQCQTNLATAKEKLRGAREVQRVAAANAERLAREGRKATADSANAGDAAAREGAGAAKIENKLATATDGELAHTRSEFGTVSTLAKHWEARITDMKIVHENIGLIVGLIDPDAIRVAVNKRMTAGNRDVPGVEYEQVSDGRSI